MLKGVCKVLSNPELLYISEELSFASLGLKLLLSLGLGE
jgi:hypothetical protein